MASTFRQEGHTIDCISPAAGTTKGVGVLIGQLFGIAASTTTVGQRVEVHIEGVFEIGKTSALAIDPGDVVYWVPGTSLVDKTATAQKEVGLAVTTAANPSATVWVKLIPNCRASSAA